VVLSWFSDRDKTPVTLFNNGWRRYYLLMEVKPPLLGT